MCVRVCTCVCVCVCVHVRKIMSLVENALGPISIASDSTAHLPLQRECAEQRKPLLLLLLLLLLEAPSLWEGGFPGVTQLGGKQLTTPGIQEVT